MTHFRDATHKAIAAAAEGEAALRTYAARLMSRLEQAEVEFERVNVEIVRLQLDVEFIIPPSGDRQSSAAAAQRHFQDMVLELKDIRAGNQRLLEGLHQLRQGLNAATIKSCS